MKSFVQIKDTQVMFSKKLELPKNCFFFCFCFSKHFPISLLQIFGNHLVALLLHYNAKVFLSNWRKESQNNILQHRLCASSLKPLENSFKTTRKICTLYLVFKHVYLELKFASNTVRDFTVMTDACENEIFPWTCFN